MVNKTRRYLRAYYYFLKNSFSVDIEYRLSFLIKNITSLSWVAGSLFFINVLFSKVSSIGGWSQQDVTLLYISFSLSMDFFDLFLRGNLVKFSELIRKGDLDRMLMRPINSRFMVSLMGEGIESTIILRFLMGFILFAYFLPTGTSASQMIGYFVILALGNFAVYSAIFILHVFNIWLVKVDNLTVFSQTTFGFTRVPLDSWPKAMQFFLIYLFPMGLTSNFAVLALLGKANINHFIIAVIVSVFLFTVSQKFWTFALRHYSSASS